MNPLVHMRGAGAYNLKVLLGLVIHCESTKCGDDDDDNASPLAQAWPGVGGHA